MKKILLASAATTLALTAMPVQAASIISSATGLSNPASTITFDEVALSVGDSVTGQFAGFGLSLSPELFYTVQNGFPNINGNNLGNFAQLNLPSPSVVDPVILNFGSLRTAVAFAMVSNNGSYTFESLLGGSVVESFTSDVDASASNFYGFSSSAFDSIRITNLDSDFFLLDNVQISAAVPEPATWAFMIFGFGAIGGALRSNRRRQRKANVKVSYA